jgi:hypothetical protein
MIIAGSCLGNRDVTSIFSPSSCRILSCSCTSSRSAGLHWSRWSMISTASPFLTNSAVLKRSACAIESIRFEALCPVRSNSLYAPYAKFVAGSTSQLGGDTWLYMVYKRSSKKASSFSILQWVMKMLASWKVCSSDANMLSLKRLATSAANVV